MASTSMDADLADTSEDGFLGGRIRIVKPVRGYRAGIDPVLLAAAVPARSGESVLDLGCGVGTALLCLGARVPGLRLEGLELQPGYAALARRNSDLNGAGASVHEGSVTDIPAALKAQTFDHVIMNPPFFDEHTRTSTAQPGREQALSLSNPLADWCDAGLRRLRPGGHLTLIHLPEKLPELLGALAGRASITLRPLAPRTAKPAHRVILVARKGGKSGLSLAAPSILHRGERHETDGESYRPEVAEILRDGAPWPWNNR